MDINIYKMLKADKLTIFCSIFINLYKSKISIYIIMYLLNTTNHIQHHNKLFTVITKSLAKYSIIM